MGGVSPPPPSGDAEFLSKTLVWARVRAKNGTERVDAQAHGCRGPGGLGGGGSTYYLWRFGDILESPVNSI